MRVFLLRWNPRLVDGGTTVASSFFVFTDLPTAIFILNINSMGINLEFRKQ